MGNDDLLFDPVVLVLCFAVVLVLAGIMGIVLTVVDVFLKERHGK